MTRNTLNFIQSNEFVFYSFFSHFSQCKAQKVISASEEARHQDQNQNKSISVIGKTKGVAKSTILCSVKTIFCTDQKTTREDDDRILSMVQKTNSETFSQVKNTFKGVGMSLSKVCNQETPS